MWGPNYRKMVKKKNYLVHAHNSHHKLFHATQGHCKLCQQYVSQNKPSHDA